MHAQQYDFALGAYQSVAIEAAGEYVKVLSCTGPVRIELDTGPRLDAMAGQGVRKESFNRVLVTDKSGAANVGKVLIAYGEMIDDRITGEVSVIDGSLTRVRAGLAFGSNNIQAGVAANYMHLQWWNPVGSNRIMVVDQYSAWHDQPGIIGVHFNPVQMATDDLTANSKCSGMAAGVTNRRHEARATIATIAPLYSIYAAANDLKQVTLSSPIVVMPGYGISVVSHVLGAGVGASIQFYEVPM